MHYRTGPAQAIARGFSLQWLRHLLTNGPLNQQFHLQRAETLAEVLSTCSARLVSIMLSTGSKETTSVDHKLKKAMRQWPICLSTQAIFELVIHSVCLTNNSFSSSVQPPSPTSRSLQNSSNTLHTLEDEKCYYCCQKRQFHHLEHIQFLTFKTLWSQRVPMLLGKIVCGFPITSISVIFLLKALNVHLCPQKKSSNH